jgi:hypothetical protein
LAKYDVDVVVDSEPPTLFVSVDISATHIPTARNADGAWEGTVKNVDLTLPAPIDLTLRGMPNRPYCVTITLTPTDESAEIDYKTKNKKLDNHGYDHLLDSIKKS